MLCIYFCGKILDTSQSYKAFLISNFFTFPLFVCVFQVLCKVLKPDRPDIMGYKIKSWEFNRPTPYNLRSSAREGKRSYTTDYFYRESNVEEMMKSPVRRHEDQAGERAILKNNFQSCTFYQLTTHVKDDTLYDRPDQEYNHLLTTLRIEGPQAALEVFKHCVNQTYYSKDGFVQFLIAKFIVAYCDGFDFASESKIQCGLENSKDELEILRIAGSCLLSVDASHMYDFSLLFCCCRTWAADTHPQYYDLLQTFISEEALSVETPEKIFNQNMTVFELLIKGGNWPLISWAVKHHLVRVSLDESRPITALHLALHTHNFDLPVGVLSDLHHPSTINHWCKHTNSYPIHFLKFDEQYKFIASHVHSAVANRKSPKSDLLPVEEYILYNCREPMKCELAPQQKDVIAALIPKQGMLRTYFKLFNQSSMRLIKESLKLAGTKSTLLQSTICTSYKLNSLSFILQSQRCNFCSDHTNGYIVIDESSFLMCYNCKDTRQAMSTDFHFNVLKECGARFNNMDFNVTCLWDYDIPPTQEQLQSQQEFEAKVRSYRDQMREVPSLQKLCTQTVRRSMSSPYLTNERINELPIPTLLKEMIHPTEFKQLTDEYLDSFPNPY